MEILPTHRVVVAVALLLSAALPGIGGGPLDAQILSSNALTVKVIDPIDSAQAAAGQRFHAVVAKDTAIAGVFLAKGADATITLVPGTAGNRWTLNLIEVTVNGKVAGVFGQNPTVVPTSAGDFLTMSKKTVSTKDRIAVAAGENIRFILGPAPKSPAPAPPAQVAGNPGPAPAPRPVAAPASVPSPLLGPVADAPPAHMGNADAVFHDINFEVRLTGCTRHGTSSTTCIWVITNQGEDGRQLGLGPASHFGLVDQKGQTISFTGKDFAGGSRNWSTTVAGLPTKATFTYDGLDPGVTTLARVSLNIGTLSPRQDTQFEWHNVPLDGGAPAASAAAPTAPNGSVAEIDGWSLTLERCVTLPREDHDNHIVVECFMKIVNLKADRDFNLGGAELIDMDGRDVGCRWYKWDFFYTGYGWLGNAAEYAHAPIVPMDLQRDPEGRIPYAKWVNGHQPQIANGAPIYVYALFSDVEPSVKQLAQLRWNGAVFHNITLTPAPHVPAARTPQRPH